MTSTPCQPISPFLFQIFGVVKTPEFLDSIYVPAKNSEMRELMGQVVADLNTSHEAGIL